MEGNPASINFRDWLILDAFSDDYESVEQIIQIVGDQWSSAPPLEIIDCLERLYASDYVHLMLGTPFERAELLSEIEQPSTRRFWFGRTAKGTVFWQQNAATFGYE